MPQKEGIIFKRNLKFQNMKHIAPIDVLAAFLHFGKY
jgi:hypothetical protein